ncbi:DUF4214 domain-containing protein [Sulfitobacter sp.]|uniref:DUF4214 domain-containing protein n=1 Tax=Sulfitobacter sp. TaxID=1903071 RepID=UPI0027298C67|nr:DUF4214 domain-containing protein [Sulfitobacter sp.]
MATSAQVDAIVALYAGYFNRAPDPEGLQFWIDQIDGGREFNTIAADFAASEEATALYPYLTTPDVATPSTFITSIYQNLFNRAPDAEGLQFWTDVLESGSVSVADMIEAIINGAVDAPDATPPTFDATTLENKIEVGRDFAQDAANTSGFEFDAEAKSAAIAAIDGVTNDEATVVAAKAATDAYLAGEANEGETRTLTTGVDDINGTADNDTINALTVNATTGADASTLTAFDDIDGGAGTDTLNIYTTADENDEFPASASIKNVEIVNVLNSDGAVAALANASNYTGVQQLWQVNAAAAVTNLQASTTAGFRDIANSDLEVSAADDAASATVALDNVDDDSSLTVSGDALNSVTVAGAVVDADEDGVDAIDLTVNAGEEEESVSVNTAVDVNLDVNGKDVDTVDAAGSTGAIGFDAGSNVENITTGSGDDEVALNTVAAANNTAATVSTGEGDDMLFVNVDADGNSGVSVTADAGAGDDEVTVDNEGPVAVNLTAGAGDDKVTLSNGIDSVATTDVIDGGEGTDTVVVDGQALAAEDYILLNDVITNFEAIEFTGGTAADVDASRMESYTDFSFAGNEADTIKKVGAGTTLTTAANLTATAAGYTAATQSAAAVYAGTLDITATGTGTVTANAEAVNLTVAPMDDGEGEASSTTTTLEGDVQSATVTLTPDVFDNDTADTEDDTVDSAAVVVDTTETLSALESLTLTGNGTATVTNAAGSKLATVDASGLDSADVDGDAAEGLDYTTTNDALAETIILGDGIDSLTFGGDDATGSTYLNMDTVTGLNLIDADDDGEADEGSDTISLNGLVDFTKVTTTASSLDLALVDLAASEEDNLVFDLGGDTYIYADIDGNDELDDTDVVIKLDGGVDNDLLVDVLGIASAPEQIDSTPV